MASKFTRLPLEKQHALLQRIVSRCKGGRNEQSPVVVFDLDGTLMDNRPRTLAILRELSDELRLEKHLSAERLAKAEADQLAYLVADSMKQLGIEHPELVSRVEAFWKARFFTDSYLKHDVAVEGSVELAQACYEAGAVLVYFTGRDLPMMGLGSFQSIRDLGFPIGVVGTELVCKPDASIPDESFKRAEGPKIARVGRVVAAFDNEPGNCNAFLEMNPEADIVFVDTQHLPGAPPLDPRVGIVGDLRMR